MMNHRLKFFRWLLVLPSAVASWYLCLMLGLLFVTSLDYFCAKELMVSGHCIASWHQPVEDISIIVFVSISAFIVVLTSTLVAPTRKRLVSKTAFTLGLLAASYFAYNTSEWGAFIGTSIVGLLAVLYIGKKHRNINES
jgi:hypothetical protein